jgi:hypothetical protein
MAARTSVSPFGFGGNVCPAWISVNSGNTTAGKMGTVTSVYVPGSSTLSPMSESRFVASPEPIAGSTAWMPTANAGSSKASKSLLSSTAGRGIDPRKSAWPTKLFSCVYSTLSTVTVE